MASFCGLKSSVRKAPNKVKILASEVGPNIVTKHLDLRGSTPGCLIRKDYSKAVASLSLTMTACCPISTLLLQFSLFARIPSCTSPRTAGRNPALECAPESISPVLPFSPTLLCRAHGCGRWHGTRTSPGPAPGCHKAGSRRSLSSSDPLVIDEHLFVKRFDRGVSVRPAVRCKHM